MIKQQPSEGNASSLADQVEELWKKGPNPQTEAELDRLLGTLSDAEMQELFQQLLERDRCGFGETLRHLAERIQQNERDQD